MTTYDAVVIGSGPNGLVAANHLADAGWSVLVLEAQPATGGAVRHDREVHPDFVHDTFSAFYPFSAISEPIRSLHLEDHGLAWSHAPAVLGHPTADGEWALLHRDRAVTAAGFESRHPGDGDAWLRLCEQWDKAGGPLVRALLAPFPPVRPGLGLLARLPSVGGLGFVQDLLMPATTLGRTRFGGEAPRLLLAGNSGHADIPIDAPGSGVLGLLLTMLGQTVGFPVPEGGSGALTGAMVRRLVALGGEVRTGAEVVSVEVRGGRATAVVTAEGERVVARRAVVADTSAPALFGRLVAPEHLPARVLRGMEAWTWDPATFKVDWALDGPIPWASAPAHAPGTFHVADSVEQMGEALTQVASGAIPAKPFMLAGQMTTSDPTRSPAGTESVWAYTHVPHQAHRDAGPDGLRGTWDASECERFADRMQQRVEALAPGFGSLVRTRRIQGPLELERSNANLVNGALGGGTAQLHQELVFRPVPGLGRSETGVAGLYLASSAAHPGGGVHGAPGHTAARAALLHHRAGGPRRVVGRLRG